MTELWQAETLARIEAARRRIRALRELASRSFPREVPSTGAHGEWPITGWGMLARMAAPPTRSWR